MYTKIILKGKKIIEKLKLFFQFYLKNCGKMFDRSRRLLMYVRYFMFFVAFKFNNFPYTYG